MQAKFQSPIEINNFIRIENFKTGYYRIDFPKLFYRNIGEKCNLYLWYLRDDTLFYTFAEVGYIVPKKFSSGASIASFYQTVRGNEL